MLWWPVATILITLPLFVWEDWKFRELKDSSMGLLLLLNLPFLIWAYGFGGFTWEEMVVSSLPILIYYLLTRFSNDYFHGDDFIYMGIVSLCLVVNPMHPFSSAIPVKILIYMGGVLVLVSAANFLRNVLTWKGEKYPNILTLINHFEGGFPMMFVFAPTIILALIL
jgi:hypothetical protein